MNGDGGMVIKVKKLIRTVSFELKFKLIAKYKNKENEFNSVPVIYLMKSCDNEARRVIKTIRIETEEIKMVKFEKCCISTNDGLIDRPDIEAARIIDAIESENNYLLEKFNEYYDLIYKKSRNVFSN